MSGDMNRYNDTVEVAVDYINSTAQSVPLAQNFDTFNSCSTGMDCGATTCALGAGWTNLSNQTSDDIDWRVNSGPTASSSTGPSSDVSGSEIMFISNHQVVVIQNGDFTQPVY